MKKKSHNIWNIPNQITVFRIILIPIFIISLYLPYDNTYLISAALFLIIALTDSLDGYLARRLKQITDFGKLMDPLADKLLVLAAVIFLIGRQPVSIPSWIAFLIIMREILIVGLRSLDSKKLILSASWLGKAKTFFQFLGIFLVLLNLEISFYFLLTGVIFSYISLTDYMIKARKLLSGLA